MQSILCVRETKNNFPVFAQFVLFCLFCVTGSPHQKYVSSKFQRFLNYLTF